MILLFSAAPVALPVSAARSDSRRRLAQQASRCSKGCRFCLREEIRGGGWCSRLPVVQKAVGSACAKRFAAAAGAAGFPLLKKAAGSACAKRFAAADAAGFPLFKEAVGSASAKRFAAAAGAAGFPLFKRLPVLPARSDSRRRLPQQASVVQKGCRFCLRGEAAAAGAAGFPLFKKAAGFGCAKRFTAGAGAASFPLLKKEEKDGIALCGDFGGV